MPLYLRAALAAVLLTLAVAAVGAAEQTAPGVPMRGLGGQSFALGFNFPWGSYNYDFGPEIYSRVSYHAAQPGGGRLGEQLDDLRQNAGTRVTRWYVFNDAAQYLLFDGDGRVSGLPPEFFESFDATLELARARGIHVIPVLLDTRLRARVPRDGLPRTYRYELIADATARQRYLDYALRPLLQRYGRDPTILAWSVVNEPEWATVHPDPDYVPMDVEAMRVLIRDSVRYVHTYATQPATLDSGGLPWLMDPTYEGAPSPWKGLGLDLYLVHWYDWIDDLCAECSPYRRPAASLGLDRPVLITEFPTNHSGYAEGADDSD